MLFHTVLLNISNVSLMDSEECPARGSKQMQSFTKWYLYKPLEVSFLYL